MLKLRFGFQLLVWVNWALLLEPFWRRTASYHLVVVTSTVMPGTTGGEVRDVLERNSQRRVGEGIGLCYNPEFIALGTVISDLQSPDFVLIGESDERAGDLLAKVYSD